MRQKIRLTSILFTLFLAVGLGLQVSGAMETSITKEPIDFDAHHIKVPPYYPINVENLKYGYHYYESVDYKDNSSLIKLQFDNLYKERESLKHIIVHKEFQEIIMNLFSFDYLAYSGISPCYADNQQIEVQMLKIIDFLDLDSDTPLERMKLMEEVVKSGCASVVKKLTEKMLSGLYKDELFNFNSIMRNYYKTPIQLDRPIFWLAAIVTRHDINRVSEENYIEIERYLCEKLCSSGKAILYGTAAEFMNGKEFTRDEYVRVINDWKIRTNYKGAGDK